MSTPRRAPRHRTVKRSPVTPGELRVEGELAVVITHASETGYQADPGADESPPNPPLPALASSRLDSSQVPGEAGQNSVADPGSEFTWRRGSPSASGLHLGRTAPHVCADVPVMALPPGQTRHPGSQSDIRATAGGHSAGSRPGQDLLCGALMEQGGPRPQPGPHYESLHSFGADPERRCEPSW